MTITRLILASSVVYSHSFIVTEPYGGSLLDPTLRFLPFSVARLAVFLFFTLSGFLVTGSILKSGVTSFLVARALRVVPGLYFMLFLTIPLLGFLFSSQPFNDYIFSNSVVSYAFRHLALRNGASALSDVFSNNFTNSVNISIWTIPYEVRCYIILAAAYFVGIANKPRVMAFIPLILAFFDLGVASDYETFLKTGLTMSISFFVGVNFYLFRDRVFLSWPLTIVLVGIVVALPVCRATAMLAQVVFGYTSLVAAILVPKGLKAISSGMPDYSYGLYIYAFPAQQVVLATGIGTSPYENMICGLLLALPFSMISWHVIEKPAMALRPIIIRGVHRLGNLDLLGTRQ